MTALRASSTATAPPATKTEWSKTASRLRSHIGSLRTVSNDYRLARLQVAGHHFRRAAIGNSDDNILWLGIALRVQHEYDAGALHCPLGRYEFDLLRGI